MKLKPIELDGEKYDAIADSIQTARDELIEKLAGETPPTAVSNALRDVSDSIEHLAKGKDKPLDSKTVIKEITPYFDRLRAEIKRHTEFLLAEAEANIKLFIATTDPAPEDDE